MCVFKHEARHSLSDCMCARCWTVRGSSVGRSVGRRRLCDSRVSPRLPPIVHAALFLFLFSFFLIKLRMGLSLSPFLSYAVCIAPALLGRPLDGRPFRSCGWQRKRFVNDYAHLREQCRPIERESPTDRSTDRLFRCGAQVARIHHGQKIHQGYWVDIFVCRVPFAVCR